MTAMGVIFVGLPFAAAGFTGSKAAVLGITMVPAVSGFACGPAFTVVSCLASIE